MSSAYEQFIAANHNLMNCYAQTDASTFSAMSGADQQNLCKSEAETVRGFLASGNLRMSHIINQRIASMDAAGAAAKAE